MRSLWLHKLRAFLSVLGIIIGTGAVIALMAFGEGSMQEALDDIKRLGTTNVIIRSVKPPDDSSSTRRTRVASYGLTKADYEKIATLGRSGAITRMVPMRVFPAELRRLAKMHNGRAVGTTPEYADVNQLEMAAGRFLVHEDGLKMRNVCVIGSAVATSLFPFGDPMDETVRVGAYFYRVVGVLRERMPTGGTGGSQAAEDYNQDIYIPLETVRVRFGETIAVRTSGSFMREQVELSQITLTVAEQDQVRAMGDEVRSILSRHQKNDWAVTVPLDRLELAERTKAGYQLLLVLIASISLLVGGIGIMNIMLATVTERTREIGIRRALGAKQKDITLQFLIEAVVQTTLGGVVGAVMGLAVVFLVPWAASWWEFKLPARVHVPSIFISLAVSVTVGVAFGLYPARMAAKMDPIEALRHV
ncbi:MAG: ABC transporter permease [Gemmataceae bacterium]|nr:ABC transporter permease [Gemmataceae bacterium]